MTRTVFLSVCLLLASLVAPLWAVEFNHKAHIEEYGATDDCKTCHRDEDTPIVPSKDSKVCLECHDQEFVDKVDLLEPFTHGAAWSFNHGAEARRARANCTACHTQSDCLDCHKAGFSHEMGSYSNDMMNIHRSDFLVTHPISARAEQDRCYTCHEPHFCSDCHDTWRFRNDDIGSPSHRRTFDKGFDGDLDTIHAGVSNTQACDTCHSGESIDFHTWSVGHAREARRSLVACQACHPDGDVCLNCHSARGGAYGFNPHPDDWDEIKDNIRRASNGKTCRKCH